MPQKKSFILIIIVFSFSILSYLYAQQIKLRVTVDDSSIKATQELTGRTIGKVPINKILDAEEKVGDWYKVYYEEGGLKKPGYIHSSLVVEVSGDEVYNPDIGMPRLSGKSQEEIFGEIKFGINDTQSLIISERGLDSAIESLRPLLAKAFQIEDDVRQKELAIEIYYWLGMAYAKKGEKYFALKEMRNMFEVDQFYAKSLTRTISDKTIADLIYQAEMEYQGVISEYSLVIKTQPSEATIRINGEDIGTSPQAYNTKIPQFEIEIIKAGYKPEKEIIFLTEVGANKTYTLVSLGKNIVVRSTPSGAKVFLDGQDTGKLTSCELEYIPYGRHDVRIEKKNYFAWESKIEIATDKAIPPVDVALSPNTYVYVKRWGGPQEKILKEPVGVDFDPDGSFYVIDDGGKKIKKFNSRGQYMNNWKPGGRGFPGFKRAAGIAVDPDGNIYVVDKEKHSVCKLNRGGQFLVKWGKEGTAANELRYPSRIAVSSKSEVYVSDTGNYCIKKFSHVGNFQKVIGKKGTGPGNFSRPIVIALSSQDELFVLDSIVIQKFSSQGDFMASWDIRDKGLKGSLGMCIDKQNYIYLADSGNNRIIKFYPGIKTVMQLGRLGSGNGQFNTPVAISMDNKGNIFVVESQNNRIQQFGVSTK